MYSSVILKRRSCRLARARQLARARLRARSPLTSLMAVHALVYTNPGDGKERMVEVKFINQCPSRCGRVAATSLRASVHKRRQLLHQAYLTRLRLKDRDLLHTPGGAVGPLERGFTNATNSDDFTGCVIGFHHEPGWSDELAKLTETLADAHWQVARWQSKYEFDKLYFNHTPRCCTTGQVRSGQVL